MIPQYLNDLEDVKWFEVKADKPETLESERAIVHYISTIDLDRVRDVMMPKGMIDKDFDKAPSVWYNHNYRFDDNALPIARSMWRKKQDSGVLAKTQFAETKLADDIYQLHKGGFISTWSIGFRPAKDKSGVIEKDSIEFDEKKQITIWHKWELLEYSSTARPANVNAQDVQKALRDIEFKSDIIKSMVENVLVEAELKSQLEIMQSELNELKSLKELFDKLKADTNSTVDDLRQLIKTKEKQALNSIELPVANFDDNRIKTIVAKSLNGGR